MSIECLAEVINARKAPWAKGELTVLLMLANYAEPDGTSIFPSVERLARACRLKMRAVQMALQALQFEDELKESAKAGAPAGVLILVEEGNKPGSSRRTNEYRIDMERVQLFQGCKKCGGVICDEKGCKKDGGPLQKTPRYIDKTRHRPVKDPRRVAARPASRGGDPALWEVLAAKLEAEHVMRLENFGANIFTDASVVGTNGKSAVVIDFPKAYMQRFVGSLKTLASIALSRHVIIRAGGREI